MGYKIAMVLKATRTFGPFVLDRSSMSLLRDSERVAIGQRGLALLEALLDADGVVTKAILMEAGWPGTFVEESNLTVQIAALRRALGSREDGQEWIVTVPRVGYRLARSSAAVGEAVEPQALPSLAVLPFQNISSDPEQDYFADGVVEEIITALSRFRSFIVISRSSSFAYRGRAVDTRQAGIELGVRYLLEGSVRRSSNQLRVTAQLIDAQSGAHLWAQKYDGAVEDVFDTQERITESVASVIEPEIRQAEILASRQERPNSIAAYDLYLRGMAMTYSETPDGIAAAALLFDRALAIEPRNGVYMMMSAWVAQLGHAMGRPEAAAMDSGRVQRLCHAAVVAAPNDGTVLARCALMLAHNSREYEVVQPMVARALEVNPNSTVVMLCAGIVELHCGDLDRALTHFRRLLALSPNDPEAYRTMTGLAHALMVRGQFEEALQWAERSLALNRNWTATYWMLIAGNAHLGQLDAARRYLAMFESVSPGTTIQAIRHGQPAKYADRVANVLEGLRIAGLS